MLKTIITSILFLCITTLNAQELYTNSFGNPKDQPVIFLHGGPGYNASVFEGTTAEQLSKNGFYVIVYDRRGEGRSKDTNAKFSFKETFSDLNLIYEKYNFESAILIGHSFGGVVATLFAESYPDKIDSIMLVGAPVSLQDTFLTILKSSKTIYKKRNDSINLNYITMLEKMDSTSIQYSSYCFTHAMQNGFYRTKNPTGEAKSISTKFKTDTLRYKYASKMTYQATQGFFKNEKYTTIDLTSNIKKIKANNIKIFGLYGKEDGLYSEKQIADIKTLLGKENLVYFDNCSHNVFVDQQSKFIDFLIKWSK